MRVFHTGKPIDIPTGEFGIAWSGLRSKPKTVNGIGTVKRQILAFALLSLFPPFFAYSQNVHYSTPYCCQTDVHPAYCTCLRYRKVVNTRWHSVPQLSYRSYVHTQYRPVPIVERIPYTTYRTVLRDEGEYRTIWVPRIVPRTVSQTSLHTRIRHEYVPEQTIRQQPVWSRRLVPEYNVRYVPYWSSGYIAPSYPQSYPQSPAVQSNKLAPIVEPQKTPGTNSDSVGVEKSKDNNDIQGPSFVMPSPKNRTLPVTPTSRKSQELLSGFSRKEKRGSPTAARVWQVSRARRR